jgi:formate hydrogenlyase subunit 6/NADH:ubiquinone oxidoreductase subunit I
MKKCPSGAICVRKEEKTWSIDRLKCVVCNCCVEVCPAHCLTMETSYFPCVTEHRATDVIAITYVKPERPKRPETGEKGEEGRAGSS